MSQAVKLKQHATLNTLSQRLRETSFIALAAVAVYLLVALASFNPTDPSWTVVVYQDTIANLGGRAGAWLSDMLFVLFGSMAYLVPITLLFCGATILRFKAENFTLPSSWSFIALKLGGFVTLLVSTAALCDLFAPNWQHLPMSSGGLLGQLFGEWMLHYFNELGATVLLLGLVLVGGTWVTGISWINFMDIIGHYGLKWLSISWRGLQSYAESTKIHLKKWSVQFWAASCTAVTKFKQKAIALFSAIKSPKKNATSKSSVPSTNKTSLPVVLGSFAEAASGAVKQKTKRKPKPKVVESVASINPEDNAAYFMPEPLVDASTSEPAAQAKQPKQVRSKKTVAAESAAAVASPPGTHTTPSLQWLEAGVSDPTAGYTHEQLAQLSRLVEQRLAEFGVSVQVVDVHPGPVITRFELELAPGVKVSRVSNLAKDLARALSIISVRVVEVIPGRPVVGLEIPNTKREIVRLKDILADDSYQDALEPLTLGLGKDISGQVVNANLAKMPHLLVAGTTGSGKSVGINAMLLSILYKATPSDVRLILIDPKMLELAVYDDIPHLLTPVVTDMKDASNALRWCVGEMERRYQLMAAVGVRNLEGYNTKVKEHESDGVPLEDPLWIPPPTDLQAQAPYLEVIPSIVVVVDEFADMMMVVGKKVEELIARIAQKARAAGIHLVLATQRPSVDVITGLIKANIPTRIAFQVSSKIDSRTILDQAGAEQLLGHGDMLFLPPGAGIPTRVHGAFVTDQEVHNVVAELRKSGKPDYIEDIVQTTKISGMPNLSEASDSDLDPLFDEAVAIIVESRRATISHLQRRLKIGYNRAARIIEQMEVENIVSAVQTNGMREVLAPPASR